MTQLQQALKGIVTKEMQRVAKNEDLDAEWIRNESCMGRIVIPKNINHNFEPRGIGAGLKTKINANIGTSPKHCNMEEELQKLKVAIEYRL